MTADRVTKIGKILAKAAAEGGLDQIRSSSGPVGGAFILTFFKSIYDQAWGLKAEELQQIADEMRDLKIENVKEALDLQGEGHERFEKEITVIVTSLSAGFKDIAGRLDRDEKALDRREGKIFILERAINDLAQCKDLQDHEISELSRKLADIKMRIENDPTECLDMRRALVEEKTDQPQLQFYYRWLKTVGREKELAMLNDFAIRPDTFLWWGIQGPGGTGKSRLAFDWLVDLETKGWKTGFLASNQIELFIKPWRPDMPVAMVVDYGYESGEKLPQLIRSLANTLRDKSIPAVRLLVLDRATGSTSWWMLYMSRRSQTEMDLLRTTCFRPDGTAQKPAKEKEPLQIYEPQPIKEPNEKLPVLELEPIKRSGEQIQIIMDAMEKMGSKNPEIPRDPQTINRIQNLTDGRPLYLALLGIVLHDKGIKCLESWSRDDLLDQIIDREIDLWHKLIGEDPHDRMVDDVGFVTLCNGLPADKLHDLLPPGKERTQSYLLGLKAVLTIDDRNRVHPLEPDLLGERFLLIGGLQPSKRNYYSSFDPEPWVGRALEANPEGLGQTLSRLVQDFPDQPHPHDWLTKAIACLSGDYKPERALKFLDQATNIMILEIGRGKNIEGWPWVRDIISLARQKREAAIMFAATFVPLAHILGEIRKFEELENWGKKVSGIRAIPEFSADRGIALAQAKAAVNAIADYGNEKLWIELERWGRIISELRAIPEFSADLEIALAQAKAAFNAISDYGSEKLWIELERWGQTISKLRAIPEFSADREIALKQAQAAVNAINHYGREKLWKNLERWGQTISKLRAIPEFSADREIALAQAKAAVNAISDYGISKLWNDLERWGRIISELRAIPEFSADREIALAQAKAAVNAISHYGREKLWKNLERWGRIISELRAIPQFSADREIALEQAKAAVNAISDYGISKLWNDLERWGRVISELRAIPEFSADREIALEQAKAAFNAISAYGSEKLWIELERWGQTISKVREIPEFASDREIALEQAKAAFNAISLYAQEKLFHEFSPWLKKVVLIGIRFPFSAEILEACFSGFLGAVKYHPTEESAGYLLDAAEHAPWIPPHGMEAQFVFVAASLVLENRASWGKQYELRAQKLLDQCSDFAQVVKGLELEEHSQETKAEKLWPWRKFIPQWGKPLWQDLISLGKFDLLEQALDDPWNSPEDQEQLKKALSPRK